MKLIELSGRHGEGKFVKVDDDDFIELSKYHWSAQMNKSGRFVYAFRGTVGKISPRKIYMHRQIVGFPKGGVVDHINHDTLDNRRCNLRVGTVSENGANRQGPTIENRAGFLGVHRWLHGNGYYVEIQRNKKREYLGYFKTPEEASAAYLAAKKRLDGRVYGEL